MNKILIDPARAIPLTKYLLNDKIGSALKEYYGAECCPTEIQGWRNYSIPDEYKDRDLLSNHWHNDSLKSDTVKIYIALHDITESHGPFHFIPREQTKRAIKLGDIERSNDEVPEYIEREDVNKFVGKIGSVLLVNTTHCLHKAGLPENGLTRDLLELRFNVSDKPCAMEWPAQKNGNVIKYNIDLI